MWKVDKTDLGPDDMKESRLLPEVDDRPVLAKRQLTVLYDLSFDVGERQNLAAEHPEVVSRLEAALDN